MPIRSESHVMSGIRESVAIMSSQKKKLYLKSGWTSELINISVENRMKEMIRPE